MASILNRTSLIEMFDCCFKNRHQYFFSFFFLFQVDSISSRLSEGFDWKLLTRIFFLNQDFHSREEERGRERERGKKKKEGKKRVKPQQEGNFWHRVLKKKSPKGNCLKPHRAATVSLEGLFLAKLEKNFLIDILRIVFDRCKATKSYRHLWILLEKNTVAAKDRSIATLPSTKQLRKMNSLEDSSAYLASS